MSEYSTLIITPVAPRDIAGIGAFHDRETFLATLQAEFSAAIPTTPGFIQAGPVTLSCLAPARYLATAPRDSHLVARLTKTLASLAAITDQSDMWEVLALSGPGVRDSLARLVQVDAAPTRFSVGHLALTRAGHLDVRLWRVDVDLYEIAVARSYRQDLHFQLRNEAAVRS